jgi:hypothetical protein
MSDSEGKEEIAPRLAPFPGQHLHQPTVTSHESTQPTQYTTAVHYHNVMSRPTQGGPRTEATAGAEGTVSHSSESAVIREMKEQLARQQQMIAQLQAERNISSAADTLRTPISTSVKRSHTTAVQRGVVTPSERAVHTSPARVDSGEYEAAVDPRVVGTAGMHFKDVLTAMKGYVLPFYADSSKDKGRTVLEFVENVESVMGNLLLDPKSPHRLMLVQLCLRDGALSWMNRKLQELTDAEKGWRDFSEEPLSWDTDMRRPFIQAHLGTNTPEVWLAKLKTLRLGEDKTKTPAELDSQFDMIARLALPSAVAGDEGSELLLATYYGQIVADSEPWIYKNILRAQGNPRTLKKWKEALSNAVLAEAHITATMVAKNQSKAADSSRGGRGAWRGRGGQGRGGGSSANEKKQSLSAAETADSAQHGEEGSSEEGVPYTPQLSAAYNNRGGRGDRGGRGGGNTTRPYPRRTQDQFDEMMRKGQCLRCAQEGHRAFECTNAAVHLSTPQSKEKAGQQ